MAPVCSGRLKLIETRSCQRVARRELHGCAEIATLHGGIMEADILKRDPVLGEIVRRLVEAYQPERIYLFGSKAPG